MKILFLGKRFYTNRDAYTERFGRIFQLPYHWAESGENVSLWLIDYYTREYLKKINGTLDVISFPMLSWATVSLIVKQNILRDRFDIVMGSGDCYIGMLAWTIAYRNKSLFVFDIYDKYDEFGGYRRLPWFDPFSFLLRRADFRTFASRALPEIVGNRSEADFIVPNGVDTDRFYPLERIACRQAIGLSNNLIYAGYFGSMEADRGVDDLVSAIHFLHTEGLNIKVLIGGKNPPDRYLKDPLVHYLGDIPFERMPIVIGCTDVLVVPYRRSSAMDQGASCKIGEYISSGKPIVTTSTPNFIANFPKQARDLGDAVCEPGNPSDLARALRVQLLTPRHTEFPVGFSWKDIALQTLSILQSRLSV